MHTTSFTPAERRTADLCHHFARAAGDEAPLDRFRRQPRRIPVSSLRAPPLAFVLASPHDRNVLTTVVSLISSSMRSVMEGNNCVRLASHTRWSAESPQRAAECSAGIGHSIERPTLRANANPALAGFRSCRQWPMYFQTLDAIFEGFPERASLRSDCAKACVTALTPSHRNGSGSHRGE